MRQGFVIAAIVLWVAINILGGLAEQQPLLQQTDNKIDMTQEQLLNQLKEPDVLDADVTFIGKVGSFLINFGKILTLYHPALWEGTASYIYFLLILPIGISFWVVFVFMLRGVGSS